MSPAQVNKNKKYFLLDQSEHLDVVLHGTADEFRLALHGAVDVTNIEKAINQEKVFSYGKANNCIIVEDFDYNDTLKEVPITLNLLRKKRGKSGEASKLVGTTCGMFQTKEEQNVSKLQQAKNQRWLQK